MITSMTQEEAVNLVIGMSIFINHLSVSAMSLDSILT
jgi:hypothetical protein